MIAAVPQVNFAPDLSDTCCQKIIKHPVVLAGSRVIQGSKTNDAMLDAISKDTH